MAMDFSYPQETRFKCRKTSPGLEPNRKKKEGGPKNTWQRIVTDEAKKTGKSWSQITKLAKDRRGWRRFVNELCSSLSDGQK